MQPNPLKILKDDVESKLSKAVENGGFTGEEAAELQLCLSRLALNMTVCNVHTSDNSTASAWLFRTRIHKLYIKPMPSEAEWMKANQLWNAAINFGFITTTGTQIQFLSSQLQAVFCCIHFKSRSPDNRLLHLTAKDKFKQMWQVWHALDDTLPTQLMDFIYHAATPRVKSRGIIVLGYLCAANTLDFLISLLASDEPMIRLQSCRALAEFANERAIKPLAERLYDPESFIYICASQALTNIGAPAVSSLIDVLRNEKRNLAFRAIYALYQIGEPAIEPLIRALRDENKTLRSHAALTLYRFKNARLVSPLIEALQDDYAPVRANAAQALGQQGDQRAVDALLKSLNDSDPDVSQHSATALGMLKAKKAVKPLINRLNDPNQQVINQAAYALGMIGDKKALLPLVKSFYKRPTDRLAHSMAMFRDDRVIDALVWALGYVHTCLNELPHFTPKKVANALLKAYQKLDKQKTQRYIYLLFAMGDNKDPRFIPILLEALQDPRSEVRQAVPVRLASFSDPRIIPTLLRAGLEGDEGMQQIVLSAIFMRQINDPQIIPFALKALESKNENLRSQAISALIATKDPSIIPYLIEALNFPWSWSHSHINIIHALGEFGDSRAIPSLKRVQGKRGNYRWVNEKAKQALAQIRARENAP